MEQMSEQNLKIEKLLPACRHAVRTISSPDVSSVWRVVSEDSNQLGSGFLAVHRLGDLSDFDEPFPCEVSPESDDLNTLDEPGEIVSL
jgi:hypothetical protein